MPLTRVRARGHWKWRQYAARAKLIVCDPRANIKGGEGEDAEDDAAKNANKKKEFDFLPRFMRQYHGPRRTWQTGEEMRENAIAQASPDLQKV